MTDKCLKSTETAKRSRLYRTAAIRCEKEHQWGACIHIWFAGEHDTDVSNWSTDPEVEKFRAVFKPEGACGSLWWEDDDPRILSLCFMAAMVETGDA